MRKRKRYIRLKRYTQDLPLGTDFLFQDENGFVFRSTIEGAKALREEATLISGSIRKLKGQKR